MDRYQRVEKPKQESPINENEIRITSQGLIRNYISYAMSLLQEKGAKDIVLKAMGQAISKTVAISEILRNKIPGFHQDIAISSTSITNILASKSGDTLKPKLAKTNHRLIMWPRRRNISQKPLVGRNLIDLPTELKMKILESLPVKDIARVSGVNSEFRDLASNDDLWKQKFLEEFPATSSDDLVDLKTNLDDLVDWKTIFVECWNMEKALSIIRINYRK